RSAPRRGRSRRHQSGPSWRAGRELSRKPGSVPDWRLPRGQAGRREGRNGDGLEAAGCLDQDEVGLQHLETRYEVVEPDAGARDSEKLTTWTHGNIEGVLRNVDTNGDLLHGDPSLSKRARGAAPATVRVRWNSGRGARLRNGLRRPGVRRTPARYRASLARRVG